ncbi:MAG: hypothetical protein NZ703_13325 [Gemmataceae bacterium]|nr:hypothetical protein [Gemmataceae bacterium]MCS7272056.1 hypothetical protein [Gemmataceae bacterium]MDW8244681.1 DUF6733 family protein [Thermogemmata sp.]
MLPILVMGGFITAQEPAVPPAPATPSALVSLQTTVGGTAQPAPVTNGSLRQDILNGCSQQEENSRTTTIVGTPYPVKASSEGPFSGAITLNQDSFFGFYPILSGSYSITDRIAFTFYGLFWTNPGFSPTGTGTGLWTEFGFGVNFSLFDGAVSVNPAIGYLNGSLLSGSSRATVFDGIVAQISFSHAGKYTEGQLYGAYYIATSAPSNNNFVHWWVTGGVRPFADRTDWTQIFSTGFHFEQLYQTKAKVGDTSNIYTWLGPYVQITFPNSIFLRITTGWDLQDRVSSSFYKATMGFAF